MPICRSGEVDNQTQTSMLQRTAWQGLYSRDLCYLLLPPPRARVGASADGFDFMEQHAAQ